MGSRLKEAVVLLRLLLLLLQLLLLWLWLWLAKNIIAIRVIVEGSLLWLERSLGLQEVVLLPELIVTGLLSGEAACVSICITCLLRLESRRLRILIV